MFKIPDKAPQNGREWQVSDRALILEETGNLLMLPGRAKDKGEWIKTAKALVDAGLAAFEAADVKDANALTDGGDKIDETCETCHAKYLPEQSRTKNCRRAFPAALTRTAAPVAVEPSEIRVPKYVTNSPAVARPELDKALQSTSKSRAHARDFRMLLGTDLKPTIVELQVGNVEFLRTREAR